MTAALSELGVTEFLTLARVGFLPRGLVIGSCVFSAGTQYDWSVRTAEIQTLSKAMQDARENAQYLPGSINNVDTDLTAASLSTQFQTVSSPLFNHPEKIFPNNARTMQLAGKISF